MSKMLSFYMKIAELDIRSFINQILYYYRKIPLLKELAPGSSYRMSGIKEFLSTFSPIGTIAVRFAKSVLAYAILLLICFGISETIVSHNSLRQVFLNVILTGVLLDFSQFYFNEMNEKVLIHYNLFKVNPKIFVFSGLFIQGFVSIFGRFLALLFLSRIIGIESKAILAIALITYLSSIIYNGINMFLLDKGVIKTNYFNRINIAALIVIGIGIVASFILNVNLEVLIINPTSIIILLALAFISILYLNKFNKYTETLLDFEQQYSIKGVQTQKDKIETMSSLKAKDLDTSKSHIREGLKGYDLLNEIFFQRHRRILLNPILLKSGILVVALLLIASLRYWNVFDLDGAEIAKNISENLMFRLPGIIPFASYIVFFQESMTRTMFINCDQALMQYGFYRRPSDLLKMFGLRLRKLLMWNSIPLILTFLWFVLMKFMYNLNVPEILIVILQLTSLWVFFSVHTLFIYYIFQPYNDAYELKHPIYQIINTAVYIVCYMSFNLSLKGSWVAPLFIGIAALYSGIALFFVYKLAPNTFKVRINK